MSKSGADATDADIQQRLAAVPPERWEGIAHALAAVENEAEHARWEGGNQVSTTIVDGDERPVIQMPYPVYTPAVEHLRYALGDFVVPFAWMDWHGITTYRRGAGMRDAPVADAVRMVTAVLRSERFSDGSIAGAIDDGTLPAAVRRLLSWYESTRAR